MRDDGTYTTTPKESLEQLADELLGANPDTSNKERKSKCHNKQKDVDKCNEFINKKRLLIKAVSATKDNKAPGEDGIYNEIIKTSIDIIGDPLIEILKVCIQTGYVPKIW